MLITRANKLHEWMLTLPSQMDGRIRIGTERHHRGLATGQVGLVAATIPQKRSSSEVEVKNKVAQDATADVDPVQCGAMTSVSGFLCEFEPRGLQVRPVGHAPPQPYLGVDRADLPFAVKEACRGMAAPDASDSRRVQRIATYLQLVLWAVISTRAGSGDEGAISTHADSNWAGCRRSRNSTSGLVVVVGGMVVKMWGSAQITVAADSDEAEYSRVGAWRRWASPLPCAI